MSDLKFPIGKYEPEVYSDILKTTWLNDLRLLPQTLENTLSNLDEAQLQTQYRPDGWTVHQLVHHIADSHLNAYTRFKLGLTEDNPTIRPYEEKLWAKLDDVKTLPVNVSVTLLFALHARWYAALEQLTEIEWARTVFHPVLEKRITLWFLLGMYAWHGKHHVAHISELRRRNGW